MGKIGLDLILGEAFGWRQTVIAVAIPDPADIMRNMLGIQRLISDQLFLEVFQHIPLPAYDDMTHNLTVHGLCGQSRAEEGGEFSVIPKRSGRNWP